MIPRITNPVLLIALGLTSLPSFAQKDASVWLTNADKSALFQRQDAALPFSKSSVSKAPTKEPVIDIDDKQTYQSMDGFGFALTGGSAQLMMRMDSEKRTALLHELFGSDGKSIGVSYLRVSVGSSDMNDHVFSYDDLAEGQ